MTPEDRKTRDAMGNHETMLRMIASDTLWNAEMRAACLAGANALVERTCGTCLHSEQRDGASGASLLWCYRYHDRHHAPDDGCIKGWEPKEGA